MPPRLLSRLQVIAMCMHCCSSAYLAICMPLATLSPLLVPRAGLGETGVQRTLSAVFSVHWAWYCLYSIISAAHCCCYHTGVLLSLLLFAGGHSTALPLPVYPQLALRGPLLTPAIIPPPPRVSTPAVVVVEAIPPVSTRLVERIRRWKYIDFALLLEGANSDELPVKAAWTCSPVSHPKCQKDQPQSETCRLG